MPDPRSMLKDPEFYKLKPQEQISLFGEAEPDFHSMQLPEQTQFLLDAKKQYDPTYLKLLQQHNLNREAEAGLAGQDVAQTGREWGSLLRSASGVVGSSTPVLGPVVAGIGDVAAQGMELASGARQHYNPLSTAAEAGVAAIPMGSIAKRVPALAGLKTAGLPSIAGHVAEGAIVGPAAVTATSLAEGQLPSSGELGRSMLMGAGTGALFGKIARKQAAYPETATNRIVKALDISGNVPNPGETLVKVKEAVPIVHELSAGAKVNSLESLGDAVKTAKKRLWNEHIHPIIQHSGLDRIPTDNIAGAMTRHFDEIQAIQNPAIIKKATREASAWTGRSYTAAQLEKKLEQKNAELEAIYKKDNLNRSTIERTANGYKLKEADALRDVLYNHLEQLGAPNIRELKSMYGSLDELDHLVRSRTGKYRLAEAEHAGERFPTLATAGRLGKGLLSLKGRRMAGEVATAEVQLLNQPDALINSAFKMLDKSSKNLPKLPAPFKAGFEPAGWQQPRGPVIDVNPKEPSLLPIPRPPSSLSQR